MGAGVRLMTAKILQFPSRRRVTCSRPLCKKRFITAAHPDDKAYCSYSCGVEDQPKNSAWTYKAPGEPS